jgi:hypothetical protein
MTMSYLLFSTWKGHVVAMDGDRWDVRALTRPKYWRIACKGCTDIVPTSIIDATPKTVTCKTCKAAVTISEDFDYASISVYIGGWGGYSPALPFDQASFEKVTTRNNTGKRVRMIPMQKRKRFDVIRTQKRSQHKALSR